MKRYYAAQNQYGSESSVGFASTWDVLVFSGKKARDNYVDNSDDLSVSAILKSQIKDYINALHHFPGKDALLIHIKMFPALHFLAKSK